MGFELVLVEPVRQASLTPAGASLETSDSAAYFRAVAGQFGIAATLLLEGTTQTVGLSYDALREAARRADLLLNVSGMLTDGALIDRIPTRAYLDLDPAFVQL